ncbi:MAG: DUF1015 domain-containing protein [Candidatus Dormibacteraeota bacterium]|nr:DUF1015 domain-containing protein [Candidatus Dormibacteraeota bacterium]
MADVRGFPALRYAGDLGPVVAPPYDVITDEQVAALKAACPHSVVYLTRPGRDYQGAAATLERWRDEGVLVTEPRPVMYLHETKLDPERSRLDLVAVLRVEPYETGAVVPHERTHRGPKEDRLALLRASGTSLEPLWFLADGLRTLLAGAPAPSEVREFVHEGRQHVLRRIDDQEWIARVRRELDGQPVLIADGHHRYETTLAYAEERAGAPDAASRFTLALLSDLRDPGLEVQATHRVLRGGVAVTGGEAAASLEEVLSRIEGRVAAGYYRQGRFQVLPLEGTVAAVELHEQVIDNLLQKRDPEEHLRYTRDAAEAVRLVDEGWGDHAFFLGTPDLAAILAAARGGVTMPQKTTYFTPKPPSGMAFHELTGTSVL